MKFREATSRAQISLDYLLKQFPIKYTYVRPTRKGISNVEYFKHGNEFFGGYIIRLPSCGGVGIDISIKEENIMRDDTKILLELKRNVLHARPASNALNWDFYYDYRNPLFILAFEAPMKASSSVAILQKRRKDSIEASKNLENGLIVDLFVDSEDFLNVDIIHSKGEVQTLYPKAAKGLRKLLKDTANRKGPLNNLDKKWEEFYKNYLTKLAIVRDLKTHKREIVNKKSLLIIKSNEVNYKYSNIEKVPVLAENFVVFIASKNTESKDALETTAKELIRKINNIPTLTKENVVFAIRLPEVEKEIEKEWQVAIRELERLIGRNKVHFNPTEVKEVKEDVKEDVLCNPNYINLL
ncbi:MAG: hypothetical protein SCARUB_01274 [Candidatus Scalindua rubra]|uniref:Uncharacterized protein n=1 Tax=Candidatus Scalindua rubra TaxID=1872076 RepID=A0A1E3XD97_9BACT|nr:MAG: hypothetical protein SCARUB_01274 [Candidatus Scalindua rubra]